jgi:hypothetical protein
VFVADFSGDGFHGQFGGAEQMGSALDPQALEESDGRHADCALHAALQVSLTDADGACRVGQADGLAEMLADPALEGCDGGIALGKGARNV